MSDLGRPRFLNQYIWLSLKFRGVGPKSELCIFLCILMQYFIDLRYGCFSLPKGSKTKSYIGLNSFRMSDLGRPHCLNLQGRFPHARFENKELRLNSFKNVGFWSTSFFASPGSVSSRTVRKQRVRAKLLQRRRIWGDLVF